MPGLRRFASIEAVAVLALLAVAGAAAAVAFLATMDSGDADAAALMFFVGTLLFGSPVVLLVGAPAYWALLRRGEAKWIPVLAVGVAPGVILLVVHTGLGLIAIACGAATAALTHLGCRRWGVTP